MITQLIKNYKHLILNVDSLYNTKKPVNIVFIYIQYQLIRHKHKWFIRDKNTSRSWSKQHVIYIKFCNNPSRSKYTRINLNVHICIKEEVAREAYSETHKPSAPSVYPRNSGVDIQELREAERLFHQSQAVLGRQRVEQQHQVNVIKAHRILPQAIRRVTDIYKNRYRSACSRSRRIETKIHIHYNTITTIY